MEVVVTIKWIDTSKCLARCLAQSKYPIHVSCPLLLQLLSPGGYLYFTERKLRPKSLRNSNPGLPGSAYVVRR